MKKLNVLLTCGATWVPIDDVRVISNVSTGAMGHLAAQAFRQRGARVTVIEGPVTHAWSDKKVRVLKYRFFDELAALLKRELVKKYDIVVHAAAVSDFKVRGAFKGKLSSDKSLKLDLVKTPKLIEMIKALSPESLLVGFKLESRLNPKSLFKTVKPLFTQSGCDLVVANTLTAGYKGFIVDADGKILAQAGDRQRLAHALADILT